MAIELYDISVASYVQALGGVIGFLNKGRTHCETSGIDLDEIVETSLYPDMRPFRFQLVSVAHHSLGAIRGVEAGLFQPPGHGEGLDYEGLQQLVADALAELESYSRDAVNALEGKDLTFKLGDTGIPFTAEGFITSFSLPNLYFHATTAYDILRMKGVPLGKRDYMGRMRTKS
jgi:hypothetical protein